MTDRTVTLVDPSDGHRFTLVGDATDRSVIGNIVDNDGHYSHDLMRHLTRTVRPGSTVLDVGANIGPITLLLSKLVGATGHVHAFEPVPPTFEHLRANLLANGATNVTAHQVALGSHTGLAPVSYEADYAGGAHLVASDESLPQSMVEIVTLDDWVASAPDVRVDLIKCDVEGWETAFLAGARSTIDERRPDLTIEVNPIAHQRATGEGIETLWDVLRSLYPKVFCVCGDGSVTRVDSMRHLDLLLRAKGLVDLYCTHRIRREVTGGAWHRRARSTRERRALVRTHGPRGRRPDQAFVVEPGAAIAWSPPSAPIAPGAPFHVTVDVVNGTAGWLSTGFAPHPVSIGTRWKDANGHVVHEPIMRTALPSDLAPGASASGLIEVTAPPIPGALTLELGLVQEHYAWLCALDPAASCTHDIEVR